MTINWLIDSDGVLADFVSGAIAAHGRSESHNDIKSWDFYESWGMTQEQFWSPLRSKDFWLSLEPYPWAQTLLDAVGTFTIATAPPLNPDSVTAKLEWLNSHFGIKTTDVMVGSKKWLMSNEKSILVDDNPNNIEAFSEYGDGDGILFPQPWNLGVGNYSTVIDQIKTLNRYF